MTQSKPFVIGTKTYYVRTLVLGQVKQLKSLVEGAKFDLENLTVSQILDVLGEQLPQGLAILLTEADVDLEDKDIDKLTRTLEFNVTIEQSIEIISAFFDITPISSLWTQITDLINKAGEKMSTQDQKKK